jgi:esterase/lipase
MMVRHLYLVSGMGAGEDIFKNLDFGELQTHFIPWEKVSMSESFTEYVKRLTRSIDTSQDFGILGVSMGGIAAQEMTRYVDPSFLILVSTIKSHDELPPYLRIAADAKLQKIFPEQFYKWAALRSGTVVGMQGKKNLALFQQMIDQYGDDYYKWSINAVAEWRSVDHQVPYLHLHGNSDMVFPSAYIKNAEIIEDGTHFMVMNRAKEVSAKIAEFLRKLKN